MADISIWLVHARIEMSVIMYKKAFRINPENINNEATNIYVNSLALFEMYIIKHSFPHFN